MTRYDIKGKQTEFLFACGLPRPNDYGVSVLPSWNTTVFITEKTNKGFKLEFGIPCPDEGGWIDLTLFTPNAGDISLGGNTGYGGAPKEPKMKIPKEAGRI